MLSHGNYFASTLLSRANQQSPVDPRGVWGLWKTRAVSPRFVTPIHAVGATRSYVKAGHKSSVLPLRFLHSQPVMTCNALKNKDSDGQRDSSVCDSQPIRAMAAKTLVLL